MKVYLTTLLALLFLSVTPYQSNGQMKRERVNPGGPVEGTFWAPNIVGMGTVEQLEAKNLNATIMHSFGIVTDRTLQNFFGFDISPNVRLGLDYGITDYWSLGIGRTTNEKVVDVRTKLAILRQQKDESIPFSLSLKGDIGLTTLENNEPIENDLNFLGALPIARQLHKKLSIQVTPMVSHFNTVDKSLGQINTIYAIGLGTEYHLSRRYAFSLEYYPVIGERNPGTTDAFAFNINIETGGHVFQLFFASSRWHTEQFIITRNNDEFWAGDFRFGFNVNRLFSLGK